MVRVLSFGFATTLTFATILAAAAPAKACCVGTNGGVYLNGTSLNGLVLNGITFNGPGVVLQGTSPQGVAPIQQGEAAAAELHVTGIRLADGTELAVTAP